MSPLSGPEGLSLLTKERGLTGAGTPGLIGRRLTVTSLCMHRGALTRLTGENYIQNGNGLLIYSLQLLTVPLNQVKSPLQEASWKPCFGKCAGCEQVSILDSRMQASRRRKSTLNWCLLYRLGFGFCCVSTLFASSLSKKAFFFSG